MKPNDSPLGLIYFSIPCFDQVKGKRNSYKDHKNLTAAVSDSAVDWALIQVRRPGESQIYFVLKKADPFEIEEESEICLDDYSDCFYY